MINLDTFKGVLSQSLDVKSYTGRVVVTISQVVVLEVQEDRVRSEINRIKAMNLFIKTPIK